MKFEMSKFTCAFLFHFARPLGHPLGSLLFLLLFAATVEILNHNSDEHVEHEKSNQQQKRDEINQPPFAVVLDRLRINKWLFHSLKIKRKLVN